MAGVGVNQSVLLVLMLTSALACVTPWYIETVLIRFNNEVLPDIAIDGDGLNLEEVSILHSYYFFPWNVATNYDVANSFDPGLTALFDKDDTVSYKFVSAHNEFYSKLHTGIWCAFGLAILTILLCFVGLVVVSNGSSVSIIYFTIVLTSAASWLIIGLIPEKKFFDTGKDGGVFHYVGVSMACYIMAFVTLCSSLSVCCLRPPEK